MREAHRIGARDNLRDDNERAGLQRRRDPVSVRHRVDRVGCYDPDRLDAAVGEGAEHVDRLEAGLSRYARRAPKVLHPRAVLRILDVHMRGEHVGEAADLAAAPSRSAGR
jgi:hypothetical protein